MKNFKFFQNKERVFTDWMDALDDYHLGGIPMPNGYIRPINTDLYTTFRIGQEEPPEGISRRHWNMIPRELRDGPIEDMLVYIRGWEAAREANYNNPHNNPIPAELWNRGWHAWWERRNRTGQNFRNVNPNPPIDETYPEYYNIEDFDFHDVSEVRYDEETYVPYKVMLMRSVVSGNIVEGQRIIYGHPMYNFPDII